MTGAPLAFPSWASMRARWRQRGVRIELDRMWRELAWTRALFRLWDAQL